MEFSRSRVSWCPRTIRHLRVTYFLPSLLHNSRVSVGKSRKFSRSALLVFIGTTRVAERNPFPSSFINRPNTFIAVNSSCYQKASPVANTFCDAYWRSASRKRSLSSTSWYQDIMPRISCMVEGTVLERLSMYSVGATSPVKILDSVASRLTELISDSRISKGHCSMK